ncbi:hypothetical protein GU926_10005 [Nibribacter ruber]|uniref:Uncharacterized protein n=1 Tax=Nibribacter ruber TaxID=2698458 RepID=A0A6P1NZT8_9BACT|nr:hypothetical protein [Nibribacter ruber]QHL87745.1 hypothetical protein GU926_10005 [Nibribacter ruber]
MKHFTLFLFLFLGSVVGYGQSYTLSGEDPQKFLIDARAIMAGTKNAAALEVATALETAWNSGKLSAGQKTKVMELSQQMLKKKMKSRPHFESFWGAVSSAVNVHQYTGANLDQFLNVIEQTLQKQDFKTYEKFLNNSYAFLGTKTLYKGPTNGLRVLGGTFAFEYRDGAAPAGPDGGWGEEPVVEKPAAKPAPVAAAKPAAAKPKTPAPAKKPVKKVEDDPWASWDPPKAAKPAEDDPWASWDAPKKKSPAKKSTASKAKSTAAAPKKEEPAPLKEVAQPEPMRFAYVAAPLPEIKGPVVVLKDVDLLLTAPFDSVTIKKTSGAVSMGGGMFVGQGGTFTWNSMGGDATATFKGLAIEVNKAAFKAEDVTLKFPAVLENDIQGNLEYRLVRTPANGQKAYPRFISHTNDAKIKRFGADVQYVGGMSLMGNKLMSASLDQSPSTIWVSHNGEKKFRSWARNYTITDSLISAPESGIAMYQGKDSITHPGVQFKYNKNSKRLLLMNPDGLYKNTPYSNSYHKIELTSEMSVWDLQKPQIDFGIVTAKNQVPAQVASKEYFTETVFQQIQNISNFHPLYLVVGFAQKQGAKGFHISEMIEEFKMKPETAHGTLNTLMQGNFVDYDVASGNVQVLDKAFHYVEASRNKKDFDYIQLNALSPAGKNATLDLTTGDLILRGVKKFPFNADSTVYALPDSQIVRIQKNRNISFNGKVVSPNFSFKGKEFFFDYDGFFIDMAKIDSTIVTTKATDKDGKPKQSNFAMVSRGDKGAAKLYLNRPDNKSGRKKVPGYPSLDAVSGATVYFNKPEILGGVYDTTVYFTVPPFKIDSMTSNKASAISFNGTFTSGGIFPDFPTKLSVQPDGTLGFRYIIPKAGFNAYGGKGRFTDTLTMDGKGLRGRGTLSYQTASMYSPNFTFFVDSAHTDKGVKGSFVAGSVAQGSYPAGSFKGFTMQWWPYKDTLEVQTKGKEVMSMFNDRFTYKGMLGFTPAALFGDGVAESKDVAIKSPLFVFKKGLIHGNKASMEIASTDAKRPALSTYDIFLDFYLDEGYAQYAPERRGFASTVFPFAQYKSSLGAGRWDFKDKKLTLTTGETEKNSSYFYSMKPGADSLQFKATGAVYDLSKSNLIATGVPYIPVGDSYVIPDSNRVNILENAKLKTFKNAGLSMDSLAKHHQLVRGEIHIDNNAGITGNAIYQFANAATDTYNIKFNKFEWNSDAGEKKERKKDDKAGSQFFLASATVNEKDTLFILPKVRYYGDVKLQSNKKFMNFDGYAKLNFSGMEKSDWFPYKREGLNPEDVRLEIKKPALADGTPLKTGIHINNGTGKIYNTFVSQKQDLTDLDVFEVEGFLSFDKATKSFKLGDEGRAYGKSYTGNMLQYNDATKQVFYDGKFKLIEPVKGFELQAVGTGSGRTDSSSYNLNTFMAFDFDIPSQAIESMGNTLAKNVEGAPEAVDLNDETLPYKLAAFLGDKGVEEFKKQTAAGYVPFSKISSKLLHSLVLNQVQLKWSPKTNAWYSVGPISLAGVDKKDINAKINGYIEIKRGASGDAVAIFLEPTPYAWYFLNFYEGALGLASSDEGFNGIISDKAKGGGPGAGSYNFYPVEQIEKMEFVNYFRKNYLGKEPLKAAPAQPVYNTFDTAPEEESGKKSKKKKKEKTEEVTDAAPPGFETPPAKTQEEAPAKSKKEKKKKDAEVEPAPDIPVADPVKEDSKKDKKKKKKEEGTPPPDIDPVGN